MNIVQMVRRMLICIRTWFHCVKNGLSFDKTWNIGGVFW